MTRSIGRPFAKRSLGQNFLVDPHYIARIIDAVGLTPSDTVVEIGPGRAALTRELVASGASVVAIELDRDLAAELERDFATDPKVQVIEADAATIDFGRIVPSTGKIKLVANLPYYISTAILQQLILQREAFSSMTLMFQREVVSRLTACPGDSERGFLSVLAQSYLEIQHLFDVPPSAFRPQPKIWSSVARFAARKPEIDDDESFRQLISAAFGQKRKTIYNNLKSSVAHVVAALADAEIDPSRRAETITNEEWLRLYGAIRASERQS